MYSTLLFSAPNKVLPKDSLGPWVVNVYYQNIEQLQKYSKTHEPWVVFKKEKYFTISVEDIYQYQELFSFGFDVEINEKQMNFRKQNEIRINNQLKSPNNKSIPGYSCLRTVEETFATIDDLVSNFPMLASDIKIGETWEKQNAGGQSSGYDLRVIKITNSAIAGPKPILYTTSSMHAREMAPAELNTRFAEYLLNNYGVDADVTWIVDHREIHLLLQANPDGRKRAESSNIGKRKNQNNNYCSNQNTRGIDMNRNFAWMWNQGSGSSGSQCDQVFRGPSASSELENTAIDTYLKTLFIDARGPNLNDAAADDTTGVYIDIHSEASLILWPYGFDDPGTIPIAPNDSQLATLGRKFGWYTNYYPERSNELYGADGAADDNAYGQLGVAAYTFELGGDAQTFRPTCNYVDNTIVPDNIKALIYAAKVAKTPYITASGPDIENIGLSSSELSAGTPLTVSGISTDLHFNNSNGTEATQNISKVEAYLDEFPDEIGATAIQLSASDGNFDSKSESFTGQLNTSGLLDGQHVVYLVATDSNNVEGVPYAKFFNVLDPANFGTLTGFTRDATTNQSIASVSIVLESQQLTSDAQGQYNTSISAGNYSIVASKQGYETTTLDSVTVVEMQTTNQNILMQPICASFDDSVNSYLNISNAEASGWAHDAAQGTDDWSIDSANGVDSSRAFSSTDVGNTSDKFLVSPEMNLTESSSLEFWHKYNFETSYDGAILEITVNNGTSWSNLGDFIVTGGYDTTLNGGFNQPLGAVEAWNGNQSSFTKVEVDLSSFNGAAAKIRWRMGTDSSTSGGDWLIDDIKLLDTNACMVPSDLIYKNGFNN